MLFEFSDFVLLSYTKLCKINLSDFCVSFQSVDCKRPSAGATRRKSIFRFLRLQRGSDDPAEELAEHQPHACTCAKTPQPQRKPLGTVNSNNHSMGASKGERDERRSNSRSPNRGLLRKARRSYAGTSSLLWRDRRQCTCRCRGCGGKVVPAKEVRKIIGRI